MRQLMVVVLLSVSVAACGEGPSAIQPTRPGATPYIDRTEIEGPTQLTAPGDTVQLLVFAVMSDGSRRDVTADARWTIVDERVVRVAPGGLATAVGYGTTVVYASYRNVFTRLSHAIYVERPTGPRFSLTGVARDAERGTPVAGAEVFASGEGQGRGALTDDNGFFDLGAVPGPIEVTVSKFGYADGSAALPGLDAPVRLSVTLAPNPGRFIERVIEDTFDAVDRFGNSKTHRIVTRAGGVFDAAVVGLGCDFSGAMQLQVQSGGVTIVGPVQDCRARLRFVVPDSECLLTVRGVKPGRYRLTYREPL